MSPSMGSRVLSLSWGSQILSLSWGSRVLKPSWGSLVLSPSWGSRVLSLSWDSRVLSPSWGSRGMSPYMGSRGRHHLRVFLMIYENSCLRNNLALKKTKMVKQTVVTVYWQTRCKLMVGRRWNRRSWQFTDKLCAKYWEVCVKSPMNHRKIGHQCKCQPAL